MPLRGRASPSASSGPSPSSSDESLESDIPTELSACGFEIGVGAGDLALAAISEGGMLLGVLFGDIPCVASICFSNDTGLIDKLARFSGDARSVTCLGIGDSTASSPVSQSFGGGNAAAIGETSVASVAFLSSCWVIPVLSEGESGWLFFCSGDLTEIELRCLRTTIGWMGMLSRVSVRRVARGTTRSGFAFGGRLGGGSGRARSRSCERKEDDEGTRCW